MLFCREMKEKSRLGAVRWKNETSAYQANPAVYPAPHHSHPTHHNDLTLTVSLNSLPVMEQCSLESRTIRWVFAREEAARDFSIW